MTTFSVLPGSLNCRVFLNGSVRRSLTQSYNKGERVGGGGELLTDHFLFALPSISCILNGMRFGKLLRWVQRRVLPRRGLVDVA